jgi:hypothetical protein
MGQKYAKTFKVVQDNAVTLRDLTWLTYDGLISKLDPFDVIFSIFICLVRTFSKAQTYRL